jgi:hypothetical protein
MGGQSHVAGRGENLIGGDWGIQGRGNLGHAQEVIAGHRLLHAGDEVLNGFQGLDGHVGGVNLVRVNLKGRPFPYCPLYRHEAPYVLVRVEAYLDGEGVIALFLEGHRPLRPLPG